MVSRPGPRGGRLQFSVPWPPGSELPRPLEPWNGPPAASHSETTPEDGRPCQNRLGRAALSSIQQRRRSPTPHRRVVCRPEPRCQIRPADFGSTSRTHLEGSSRTRHARTADWLRSSTAGDGPHQQGRSHNCTRCRSGSWNPALWSHQLAYPGWVSDGPEIVEVVSVGDCASTSVKVLLAGSSPLTPYWVKGAGGAREDSAGCRTDR
jgi:hypothetical protein